MSDNQSRATSTAWTEEHAREYLAASGGAARPAQSEDPLAPQTLAFAVIRQDLPNVEVVLDVASGPGGFLERALDAFPKARGIWFDFSDAMHDRALENLERFGDRVRYVLGDFSEVCKVGEPSSVDLVLTSSATHHLSIPDLERFYADSSTLLRPGGWIANRDTMTLDRGWDERLRAARAELIAERAGGPSHPHPNPMPSLAEHLAAIGRAGLIDAHEIWRWAMSCLVLARNPGRRGASI